MQFCYNDISHMRNVCAEIFPMAKLHNGGGSNQLLLLVGCNEDAKLQNRICHAFLNQDGYNNHIKM